MSRLEIISPEGFRQDGRLGSEPRSCRVRVGRVVQEADGSAELQWGLTHVVASVVGPVEQTRSGDLVLVDLNVAPFAMLDRKVFRRNDRRAATSSVVLKSVLSGLILADRYDKCRIRVDVNVLSLDGNMLAAVINCAVLACVDAGISMRQMAAAVDVGLVDDKLLVDLTSQELQGQTTPHLTAAFTSRDGRLVSLFTLTRAPEDRLEDMVSAAKATCADLSTAFYSAIAERARSAMI